MNEYRHTYSFPYFLEYVLLFLDDNVDEECEKYSNRKKFSLRALISIFLFFSQFQPGVTYKRVASEKSVYIAKNMAKLRFQALTSYLATYLMMPCSISEFQRV